MFLLIENKGFTPHELMSNYRGWSEAERPMPGTSAYEITSLRNSESFEQQIQEFASILRTIHVIYQAHCHKLGGGGLGGPSAQR